MKRITSILLSMVLVALLFSSYTENAFAKSRSHSSWSAYHSSSYSSHSPSYSSHYSTYKPKKKYSFFSSRSGSSGGSIFGGILMGIVLFIIIGIIVLIVGFFLVKRFIRKRLRR